MQDEVLDQLLGFDALQTAEDITGKSYKSDDMATAGLGLLLQMLNSSVKEKALLARNDTTFSNMLDRYLSIIEENGFEKVLELPFVGYPLEQVYQEKFFVYAHRDGLLLKFDTYAEVRVNGGHLYYNWLPKEGVNRWEFTESGHGFEQHGEAGNKWYAWIGSADAREALIYHITNLRENGQFLNQWVERPFLWLLHYMDTKEPGYSYEAINRERIAMLPEWVQEMIGPESA